MEQHSQTSDTPESRSILEGQLRECFGRVVYSHKTHEKCVEILLWRQSFIKTTQIVLSAITTAGFLTAAIGSDPWVAITGAVVSTALLALNTYTKSYNLGELAQKHKQAANELWFVRECFLSLLVDLMMQEKPLESLQEERDKLLAKLATIYEAAPSTNHRAYKKAQKALKESEDLTFEDREIDAFLPREMKRPQRGSS